MSMTNSSDLPVAGAASETGRTALVTGGSRGIGRAIAQRLAQEGMEVAVAFHMDEAAAAGVVKEIEQGGGRAVAVQADLGTVAGVRAMFAEALTHLGHLDVLVNNAGVIVPGPIGQMTEEDYERTFAVNAAASFFAHPGGGTLAVRRRPRGVSELGQHRVLPPTAAAYSGSKAALEQFTRTAAKELGGRGITVNAVSPGRPTPTCSPRPHPSGASRPSTCHRSGAWANPPTSPTSSRSWSASRRAGSPGRSCP
jgi:3-oxoacyl-[acyl-carrier protein] reductase